MTTPDSRKEPLRTCIGCRATRPQSQLVRCAVDGDHAVVSRTAAGRGAWLCSTECYRTALSRKAFGRAWKQALPITLEHDLNEALTATLTRQQGNTNAGKSPIHMKESSADGRMPVGLASTKG